MNKYDVTHSLNFESVNNNLALGLSNLNDTLTINFNRSVFCTPSGITMLSSLISEKKELINFNYENISFIRYLLRINFFQNLDVKIEEDFLRHDATVNMLECTKIQKDDDPFLIDKKLKKILSNHIIGKNNLVFGILVTTYEIVDNILEHSMCSDFMEKDRTTDKPGYVSAQYYPKNNEVEIGISDMGEGIINTMSSESEYLKLAREDILKKAFESNTSRHRKFMPTRGNGLAKLKEFVLLSNGSIRCRTNEFTIIFNQHYPDGYINKAENILGTHFEIKIGCSHDIDTKPIFNAAHDDYEENEELEDFFN